ncbi:uncharacterized protein BO66DRAFT_100904 [Aspergillus aculeatinus CBS 121060]|uniref:Uncharacterized protein n=1 Tax=Aspergillus aculeatinus CBS 121060 TaxID=1448322 RepID=A0ACD1H7J3_9EURO|nr:hypothetical protein BO66DRAFT_100904 [Aspergillus aculeatinus CBS 121060]RAH69380.1 hypothetical protein BO66DRAFT_100904 [Aspergillus aculeatinus CBS 121060]
MIARWFKIDISSREALTTDSWFYNNRLVLEAWSVDSAGSLGHPPLSPRPDPCQQVSQDNHPT